MRQIKTPVDKLGQFCILSNTIIRLSREKMPQVEFLESISKAILEFSAADSVDWWLKETAGFFRCEIMVDEHGGLSQKIDKPSVIPKGAITVERGGLPTAETLYRDMIDGHYDPDKPFFTEGGTLWTGDSKTSLTYNSPKNGSPRICKFNMDYRSIVMIPLFGEESDLGFVQVGSFQKDHFTFQEAQFYEVVAQTLAMALENKRAQESLRERVRELGCLYEVASLAELARPLEEVFQKIADSLPSAWQYPDIACARVVLDGKEFATADFEEGAQRLVAQIVVAGVHCGYIEVGYREQRPIISEGPFLAEERRLLDSIALEIAGVIERRAARKEKAKLEEQIRHADRLATIGQLAAGVAHELNEPLSSILGLAQLSQKIGGLDEVVKRDLSRIVDASLHAREIVSKLRLFARQMPAHRTEVDLNRIITDGAFFIETRCAKQGIIMTKRLADELPTMEADPGQIHQIFINLVVNAVQAMPHGGMLTIGTDFDEEAVILKVEDTGVGMTDEISDKIFMPFFTTKDVDQGTGLGLSVVHGIVSAHGGEISVVSEPSKGSCFEVKIPRGGPQ